MSIDLLEAAPGAPADPFDGMGIDEVYDLIESHVAEMAAARTRIAELGVSIVALRQRATRLVAERESRLAATQAGLNLTEAEQRVAAYLPADMTVPEIAKHLYLTTNTVKTHMKNIYRKLGAENRRQAVAAMAVRKREQRSGGER